MRREFELQKLTSLRRVNDGPPGLSKSNRVKKRFNAKRFGWLLLSLAILWVMLSVFVYVNILGFSIPDILWVREHELQYCPRCGLQRWQNSRGFFFGSGSGNVEVHKTGKAGIDSAKCAHLFFVVAADDAVLTRDLKLQKYKTGWQYKDSFWDNPLLVESFRRAETENEQHAFSLFQMMVNENFRGTISSNVVQALEGTNSAAVVDAMYQAYTNKFNLRFSRQGL